jgi:hypothetical protein
MPDRSVAEKSYSRSTSVAGWAPRYPGSRIPRISRSLSSGAHSRDPLAHAGYLLPQSDKNLFRFGRMIGPDSHAGKMILDITAQQRLIFRSRYLYYFARRDEYAVKHGSSRQHAFIGNGQFSLAIHKRQAADDDAGRCRPNSQISLVDLRKFASAGILEEKYRIRRSSSD